MKGILMMTDYTFTAGIFTEVTPGCIEKVCSLIKLQISQYWDKRKGDMHYTVKYKRIPVTLGSQTFKVTTVKISAYGNLSIYLESDDIFFRISDHWTAGSSVRNIGLIRYSRWTLKEKSKHIITIFEHKVQGGYIYKKNLKTRSIFEG
jgi:hypothetical protein